MKKIVFCAVTTAVMLSFASCDMSDNPAEDTSEYDAAGNKLVSLTINLGGTDRALTTKLAQAGIDFYEVAFKNGNTYYHTSWTKSQNGRITLPTGNYGGAGNAMLFGGTAKNKTLLAIGLLTAADGDGPDTVISHNTKTLVFTLAALETNISSDGSTTTFKITSPEKTPALPLPTVLEQGAGSTPYTVPIFNVPANSTITAVFGWNTSDDRFDLYRDGMYIPDDTAGKGILQSAGVVSNEYGPVLITPTGLSPQVSINSTLTAPVFDISFETPPENGLARIFFSQPVYALFYEPGKSIQWNIRGGLNNDILDGGAALNSTGGSILLGVGAVNLINVVSVWSDNTYTVQYNANGGTGTMKDSSIIIDVPKKLTDNEFTRYGYIFVGWATLPDGPVQYTDGHRVTNLATTVGEKVTLYAVWRAFYTVKYYSNNANGTMEDSTFIIGVEDSLSPNAFYTSSYAFAGWAKTETGTVEYSDGESVIDLSTTPGETVKLYAIWSANFYTVKYQASGGTGTMEDSIFIIDIKGNLRANKFTYTPGYSFVGWATVADGPVQYTDGQSVTSLTTTVGETVTLHAVWGIEMVSVAAGTFTMGSPTTETDRRSDETQHTVTVSSFTIGKYAVTQKLYITVTGDNPSCAKGNDNRPVEEVTWYDAVEFCNQLSILEGLTPIYTITGRTPAVGYPITGAVVTMDISKNGYRLPTEAEWEYAARGGNLWNTPYYKYPGSNTLGDVAWYQSNSSNAPHTAGTKSPNALGLYDMSGNVFEWCWDWYDAYPSGTQINPTGPSSGDYRVLRGGDWSGLTDNTRSASRKYFPPSVQYNTAGLRLVRRP